MTVLSSKTGFEMRTAMEALLAKEGTSNISTKAIRVSKTKMAVSREKLEGHSSLIMGQFTQASGWMM